MKRRPRLKERLTRLARAPRFYYAVVPLALPLVLATVTPGAVVQQQAAPTQQARVLRTLPLDDALLQPAAPAPIPAHSVHLVVERGDTLDTVLMAGGLSSAESANLVKEFAPQLDPRRLKPGQTFRFERSAEGQVQTVAARIRGWGELRASRNPDGFEVSAVEAPIRSEEIVVSADIDSSLYEAVKGAGEGADLVQSLVDVFQWDVDFFRLQDGDRFTLLVEKKFSGADVTGYGPILAARFEHRGEVYEAFRYTSPDGHGGYYSSSGTPMRKQFLKSPLKFSRITSGFSKKRFHPVLKVLRPHHGVDYGAPVGTPVMATADGVVDFAGFDGGEGNFVRLRHNSRFQTSYLHLSRFAKGIKKGSRVEQGDVIGYVGMTGLATGPHLDYRVSDGGTWINPSNLKSVTPDPLRGKSLAEFRRELARSMSLLKSSDAVVADSSRRPALF